MIRSILFAFLGLFCVSCVNGSGMIGELDESTEGFALGVDTLSTVNGAIVNPDLSGAAGVKITLSSPPWDISKCGGVSQTVTTDASGMYRFVNIKVPCQYELTVSKNGVRAITYHKIIIEKDTKQLPIIGFAVPGSQTVDLQGTLYFARPENEKALENLSISLVTTGNSCPKAEYLLNKVVKVEDPLAWFGTKYLFTFKDVIAPCNYKMKVDLHNSKVWTESSLDKVNWIPLDIFASQVELPFAVHLEYPAPEDNISLVEFLAAIPRQLAAAFVGQGFTLTDLPDDTTAVYFKYAIGNKTYQYKSKINGDSVRMFVYTLSEYYYTFFASDAVYLYIESEQEQKVYPIPDLSMLLISAQFGKSQKVSDLDLAGSEQGLVFKMQAKDGKSYSAIEDVRFKLSSNPTHGKCVAGTWEGVSDQDGVIRFDNAPWPCFYKVESQEYPAGFQRGYEGKVGKYLYLDKEENVVTLIPEKGAFTSSVEGWVYETCKPDCSKNPCGDDGCGGSCDTSGGCDR